MSDANENEFAIERAASRAAIVIPALVRAHVCRDELVRETAGDACEYCKNAFSFYAEPKAVEEFNTRRSRELYDCNRPSDSDRRTEIFRMKFKAGGLVRLTFDGRAINLFAEQERRGCGARIGDAVDLATGEGQALAAAMVAAIDRSKGTPGAS